jgi:PAS domain S-box-containing protein
MSAHEERPEGARTALSLSASADTPALALRGDGTIVSGNAAVTQLLGYTAAQWAALSMPSLLWSESPGETWARVQLALETRTVFDGEVLLTHATGRPLRCRMTVVPVNDTAGAAPVLALIEDRSRDLWGAALPTGAGSAAALLDTLPAGVVVHAPDTRILYANATAAAVLGITFDRLVGIASADPRWEFLDEREQPLPLEAFPVVQVIRTQAPVRQLLIGTRRPSDGALRWGMCDAFPLRDDTGVLSAIVVFFVDVTAIRQVESARRVADERLRLILESSHDALWDVDILQGTTYCSARFWEMLGYAEGEQATTQEAWIGLMHPDDRERALGEINASIARGDSTYECEFRMCHRDGSEVHVVSRGRVLRTADGIPTRIAGTNTDITSRRRFEEHLRQSQRLESLGQLAGGVAHDFNNLLAVIRGNLELLEAPDLSHQEIVELGREAQGAAQRGAELTKRLLAFARQQPLQLASVSVEPLLMGYAKVLRRVIPESITIDTSIAAALPSIRADAGLLETAILNLSINARDAMPHGGRLSLVARTIERPRDDAPEHPADRWVEIIVSDTGTGMRREVKERAIEPFFTTKSSGQGTGLGLSMVYGFVQQCGGALDIHSEPDLGTAVHLRFPAESDGRTSVPVSAVAIESTTKPSALVLVVEDDAAVRRLCVRELRAIGCRTIEAIDGPSAIAAYESAGRVDLLLTDVIMPGGMHGAEVARALQACQPGLPVIYMSGYHADILSDYLRSEGTHLLAKPFTIAELHAMIDLARASSP